VSFQGPDKEETKKMEATDAPQAVSESADDDCVKKDDINVSKSFGTISNLPAKGDSGDMKIEVGITGTGNTISNSDKGTGSIVALAAEVDTEDGGTVSNQNNGCCDGGSAEDGGAVTVSGGADESDVVKFSADFSAERNLLNRVQELQGQLNQNSAFAMISYSATTFVFTVRIVCG
jgi:hypothetical protein